MREDVVIVALDVGLTFLGLAHDEAADRDISEAKAKQHKRHAHIERQRCRNQKDHCDRSREVRAHEFKPQAEQGLDGAQQRVQCIRGAPLLMPGERHGDHAFERLTQHRAAARVRQAVGATRDQHEGDDVEKAKACPQRQRRHHFRLGGDGVDDAAKQDRFCNGDGSESDIGCADEEHFPLFSAEVPQGSPVDFQQGHVATPILEWCTAQ